MTEIAEDKRIEACARAAHEANRAYCVAIGDASQAEWDQASARQRASVIEGVKGVIAGNTPEQSHESWLKQKKADGWKYGPVKDPDKFEHPCFMPYAELPPEQKIKDDIFMRSVQDMYVALGGEVKFERDRDAPPDLWDVSEAIDKQTHHIPHQIDLFAAGFAREILSEHWRTGQFHVKDPRSFARDDADKAYRWAIDMLEARQALFDKSGVEEP